MLSDERLIWMMDGRRPCPARTEVYSRVVGFFRPVQQWNRGKKEEYRQRRVYTDSVTSGPACSSFSEVHE